MIKKVIKKSYYTIDNIPAKEANSAKTVSKIIWYIVGIPVFSYKIVEITRTT